MHRMGDRIARRRSFAAGERAAVRYRTVGTFVAVRHTSGAPRHRMSGILVCRMGGTVPAEVHLVVGTAPVGAEAHPAADRRHEGANRTRGTAAEAEAS